MRFVIVYNQEAAIVDDASRDDAAAQFAAGVGISHYRNLRHVRGAIYRADFEFGDGRFVARRFTVEAQP